MSLSTASRVVTVLVMEKLMLLCRFAIIAAQVTMRRVMIYDSKSEPVMNAIVQ